MTEESPVKSFVRVVSRVTTSTALVRQLNNSAATPPPSLLHRLPDRVGSPGVWFVLPVVVVSDVSADFLISAVLSALAGSVFLRLGCKF